MVCGRERTGFRRPVYLFLLFLPTQVVLPLQLSQVVSGSFLMRTVLVFQRSLKTYLFLANGLVFALPLCLMIFLILVMGLAFASRLLWMVEMGFA